MKDQNQSSNHGNFDALERKIEEVEIELKQTWAQLSKKDEELEKMFKQQAKQPYFEKLESELKELQDLVERSSQDVSTIQHQVNIIQDSNFQDQLDQMNAKLKQLDDIKPALSRFSVPETQLPPAIHSSMDQNEEQEVVFKPKKKVEAVKAARPTSKKNDNSNLAPSKNEIVESEVSVPKYKDQSDELENLPEHQKTMKSALERSNISPIKKSGGRYTDDLTPGEQSPSQNGPSLPEEDDDQASDQELEEKLNTLFSKGAKPGEHMGSPDERLLEQIFNDNLSNQDEDAP